MNIRSLGGAKYFLLFKDDFSHFRTVYFLKSKDEAADKLDVFTKMVENQFERRFKCLRPDNGTEIKNAVTRGLLEELGVFHTKSHAYTPQQNGRIEREMRTVVESARSAIHAEGLDENLWAEAVNYAVFTLNQTGTSSLKGKSPAELWFGRRVDVKGLRSFGCECYVLIQDHKRTKTGRKSKKGIFVGYDLDSPCYRIYLTDERDITSSVDVIFDEKSRSNKGHSEIEVSFGNNRNENSGEESDEEDYKSLSSRSSDDDQPSGDSGDQDTVNREGSVKQSDESQSMSSNRRGNRTLKMPAKYVDYVLDYIPGGNRSNVAMIGEVEDISTSKALKDVKWREAMSEEFEALTKMKTWNLVHSLKGVKPLTCRWVLRRKQNGRFKARLVARGF